MTRRVMAALLAAAAMIPAAASAQDQRPDRGARAQNDGDGQRQRPQLTDEQRAARAERRAERQAAGGGQQNGQPGANRDRNGDGIPDVRRGGGGGFGQPQIDRNRDDSRADDARRFRDRNGDGIADARQGRNGGNGPVIRDRNGDGIPDARQDRNGGGVPAYRDRNGDGRADVYRGRNDWNRYDGNRNYGQRWTGNYNQRWNNNWRQDRRYDWNSYRSYNRGAFHLPRYYAPYGWNYGYRRFSVGIRLAAPLFGENYWIDDPYDYRLPPAYGPYRWVRYYGDAILVDVRSGYVVDVIHDIFW